VAAQVYKRDLPRNIEKRKRRMKTTKRNFAIVAAVPAMTAKPSTPERRAMRRKMTA
jgi:hypothetical protein